MEPQTQELEPQTQEIIKQNPKTFQTPLIG